MREIHEKDGDKKMKFEIGKAYKTSTGLKAVYIYKIPQRADFPNLFVLNDANDYFKALSFYNDAGENPMSGFETHYNSNGEIKSEWHDPVEHEKVVFFHKDPMGIIHAMSYVSVSLEVIAKKTIKFTEGEGL